MNFREHHGLLGRSISGRMERGEKALESYTGFKNLLLDNPATTDQCLYKRQKLWLEMREKATAKQPLAASAVLLSVADLAPVGMANVAGCYCDCK